MSYWWNEWVSGANDSHCNCQTSQVSVVNTYSWYACRCSSPTPLTRSDSGAYKQEAGNLVRSLVTDPNYRAYPQPEAQPRTEKIKQQQPLEDWTLAELDVDGRVDLIQTRYFCGWKMGVPKCLHLPPKYQSINRCIHCQYRVGVHLSHLKKPSHFVHFTKYLSRDNFISFSLKTTN